MKNLANISEIKNLEAIKGGSCTRPRRPITTTPTPPRNPPVGGKPA